MWKKLYLSTQKNVRAADCVSFVAQTSLLNSSEVLKS
jgi:hypothetical protein